MSTRNYTVGPSARSRRYTPPKPLNNYSKPRSFYQNVSQRSAPSRLGALLAWEERRERKPVTLAPFPWAKLPLPAEA